MQLRPHLSGLLGSNNTVEPLESLLIYNGVSELLLTILSWCYEQIRGVDL